LEAPPGFEPGMEVLQGRARLAIVLARLAFWLALLGVRALLLPNCSQVLGLATRLALGDLAMAWKPMS